MRHCEQICYGRNLIGSSKLSRRRDQVFLTLAILLGGFQRLSRLLIRSSMPWRS